MIQIQIQKSQYGDWAMLQKDEDTPEYYVWDGIEFYIMTNMGRWVAVWSSNEYEYYVSATNESEIYQMLESIHREDA